MKMMSRIEWSPRTAVLPGAVVALVALMGVDSLASTSLERLHRSTAVVAYAVSPSRPALLSPRANLTCTAATLLMVVVLLRRAPVFVCRVVAETGFAAHPTPSRALSILQRKFRMSYRTGGRYAP